MIERQVTFYSDGLLLSGTIYLPEDGPGRAAGSAADASGIGELATGPIRRPTVLVCSGYLGLNAIYPRLFAGALTEAGYCVFGFDYRGTGASEGTFGRIILDEEMRDVHNAITFVGMQEEVDPDRIILLGWGMGAGIVIQVAALDQRVAAVAALNGFYDGHRFLLSRHGSDGFAQLLEAAAADRAQRVRDGRGRFGDPYEVYPLDKDSKLEVQARLEPVPHFGPPTAVELAESLLAFDAEAFAGRIAPRPLFVGHGRGNELHLPSEADSLIQKAQEPKQMYWIDGKHNNFMQADNETFMRLVDELKSWLARLPQARETGTSRVRVS